MEKIIEKHLDFTSSNKRKVLIEKYETKYVDTLCPHIEIWLNKEEELHRYNSLPCVIEKGKQLQFFVNGKPTNKHGEPASVFYSDNLVYKNYYENGIVVSRKVIDLKTNDVFTTFFENGRKKNKIWKEYFNGVIFQKKEVICLLTNKIIDTFYK